METLTKLRLAINGGTALRTKEFPKWPFVGEKERKLVMEVLDSQNWWRMSGTKVDDFEQKFATMHQSKYCIGVTNGTHAIELALSALGVGKGDEVLVPAYTFISTATAVIYCNAIPIPVDCDPQTFCISPKAIEKAITPNTKAIIPVHMAGHSADMSFICEIAKKHNLLIIEDAAHAHGGEWEGKKLGSIGDIGIFSFQNGKLMTCGEGGALITNNEEIYKKMFLIHGVGRPKYDREYKHLELGSNYRMNEFQAAVLLAQLERLEEHNQLREVNSALLDRLLVNVEGIISQGRDKRANLNTHYMYMFYYDSNEFGGMKRDEFVDCLIAEGIPAYRAYPLINKVEFFKMNNFRGHIDPVDTTYYLPYAERIAEQAVWLPHFLLLGSADDVSDIFRAINKIQECSKN